MSGELMILTTTFGDQEKANEVAHQMVDHGLAVCAQVDAPMRSYYRWKGHIHDEMEVRVTFKVLANRFQLFRGELQQIHPYAVPQLLAWPVSWVSEGYLDWARGKGQGDGA